MCGLRPPQDLHKVFFHYCNQQLIGGVLICQVLSSLLYKNFTQVISSGFVQDPLNLSSIFVQATLKLTSIQVYEGCTSIKQTL